MAYYNTGWINNPMNNAFDQGAVAGVADVAFVGGTGNNGGFNNTGFNNANAAFISNPGGQVIGGQVNNYENHDVIGGQAYAINNENYYDNYHHRYNHYYVTDTNYTKDHYIDYNVYHHDTNHVYNGADYHGAQNIFVDEDNNGCGRVRPLANAQAAQANNQGMQGVQDLQSTQGTQSNNMRPNPNRRPCHNNTVRRCKPCCCNCGCCGCRH